VLSLPTSTPLTLEGTLEQIERLPEQGELLARLDGRPDFRAITAQRTIAERSVALASGEMKPNFALTGNLQYQQDALNNTFVDASNRSYAVGVAFRLPLLAAPVAMARKVTAEAEVRQAKSSLDAALDSGRLEVTSAYTEWVASKEVVDAQQKALDLARESLSIAQVSYENGLVTSIELSDARQSMLQTQWNLMQAKFAQILAAARTRFAAGLT
jgi:outer membrane protein TolC